MPVVPRSAHGFINRTICFPSSFIPAVHHECLVSNDYSGFQTTNEPVMIIGFPAMQLKAIDYSAEPVPYVPDYLYQ